MLALRSEGVVHGEHWRWLSTGSQKDLLSTWRESHLSTSAGHSQGWSQQGCDTDVARRTLLLMDWVPESWRRQKEGWVASQLWQMSGGGTEVAAMAWHTHLPAGEHPRPDGRSVLTIAAALGQLTQPFAKGRGPLIRSGVTFVGL